MSFVTIEDLETATGETIADEDLGKTQFLLDGVCSYIETITDRSFTQYIDYTVRCRADAYGLVKFDGLTDVSDVKSPVNGDSVSFAWDYFNTIYGLCAFQVVDAVISFGPDEPPTDISTIVIDLVGSALGISPANSDVTKQRVGDVDVTYHGAKVTNGQVVVTLTDLQAAVLDKYRVKNYTWNLGSMSFPTLGY